MKIKEVAPSWNHWQKTYTSDNLCKYNRVPGAFSNKVLPDISYFTDCFSLHIILQIACHSFSFFKNCSIIYPLLIVPEWPN